MMLFGHKKKKNKKKQKQKQKQKNKTKQNKTKPTHFAPKLVKLSLNRHSFND